MEKKKRKKNKEQGVGMQTPTTNRCQTTCVFPNGKACTKPKGCEFQWRKTIPLSDVYLVHTGF